MKKCPRCELNYIKDAEELCPVCQKEVSGADETSDEDILSIVNVKSEGKDKKKKKKEEEDVLDRELEKDLPDIDGYSDMMDTEIPGMEDLELDDENEDGDEENE